MATEPASPSPPPPAPTALTPGPRALAFSTLHSKTLSKTLSAISYPSFAACFPRIAEQAPAALKGMHSSMVSRLESFATEEFETILRERDVVGNLNRLEEVIREGRRGRKGGGEKEEEGEGGSWSPHLLPARSLLAAHTTPLHQSQQSQLNAKLQTTESQNATLAAEIRAQRAEIAALLALAETLVRDLEGAAGMLGERGEGIGKEGREGEEALRAEG
ncbi:hypothetical protein QTJ16_002188 [Diplocarpon rosae]|uniref:MIND kinetochore complex component Nnf1 n=1 Tax=Diplocarpon rosae TaxID=946125 RepID=A0AAD9WF57_9HELO|nr:hypothetical protein QTJ16_002188 [Diplocarpon rosae]